MTSTGAVYTWGYNQVGEIGNGTTINYTSPTLASIPPGVTPIAVAAGFKGMIALTSTGAVYAWGINKNGESGVANLKSVLLPTLVPLPAGEFATSIAEGKYHSIVGAADGTAYAFGLNANGQLGNSSAVQSAQPVLVQMPAANPVANVAAGDAHSLALTSTGAVFAWGANSYGQLGMERTSIPTFRCASLCRQG